MAYEPHGKHFVAGQLCAGDDSFQSDPAIGTGSSFSVGRVSDVNAAAEAAEDAFGTFGYTSRAQRAAFLNRIADEIELRADDITDVGARETGLPEARLQGERGRTVAQLRLFAEHILSGEYLDRRQQVALPDRAPVPGPEHKLVQRPIGPVAVFGASNFPLAFSTAGGDTAAALAAGCPVVVKGHSAHPGTSELVASAIATAVNSQGLPPGVFSMIQGGSREVGTSLVTHPLIRAVGFTGSLRGGRALFDLCAQRPEPIPFFGELGSVNPMFLLPNAVSARATEIGAAWAASLALGAGQFCTNPGIAVGFKGSMDKLVEAAVASLSQQGAQTMLTQGIASAYQRGVDEFRRLEGVETLVTGGTSERNATPVLCRTHADVWFNKPELAEEVFGPLGLLLEVDDAEQMQAVARRLSGQLTCAVHMEPSDMDAARALLPILERKAGRILVNGFPTGVEVSDAMVHGGPYPASTNFGATSVGTLSIRRFLRPVCFQNVPDELVSDW